MRNRPRCSGKRQWMVSAAEKEAAALPSAFSTRTFLIWFARAPPGFCEFHTQGPTRLGRAFAAPRELWGNRTGSMAREAADDSADPVSSRSGKRRDGREKAETGSVRRLRAKVPATGAPPQRAPSGGRRHAISARQGATPRGGRTRGRPRGRGYSEGKRSRPERGPPASHERERGSQKSCNAAAYKNYREFYWTPRRE